MKESQAEYKKCKGEIKNQLGSQIMQDKMVCLWNQFVTIYQEGGNNYHNKESKISKGMWIREKYKRGLTSLIQGEDPARYVMNQAVQLSKGANS